MAINNTIENEPTQNNSSEIALPKSPVTGPVHQKDISRRSFVRLLGGLVGATIAKSYLPENASAEEKPEETDPEFKPLNLETPKDNFYTNLLKKKLEKGLWEDVIIKEGETETKLSEIEDLTEELLIFPKLSFA